MRFSSLRKARAQALWAAWARAGSLGYSLISSVLGTRNPVGSAGPTLSLPRVFHNDYVASLNGVLIHVVLIGRNAVIQSMIGIQRNTAVYSKLPVIADIDEVIYSIVAGTFAVFKTIACIRGAPIYGGNTRCAANRLTANA